MFLSFPHIISKTETSGNKKEIITKLTFWQDQFTFPHISNSSSLAQIVKTMNRDILILTKKGTQNQINLILRYKRFIFHYYYVIGNWFHILNHLHTTSFVNTKKARNLLSLFHQRYPHTHHTNNKQQAHANKVYYHPNDVYITMTWAFVAIIPAWFILGDFLMENNILTLSLLYVLLPKLTLYMEELKQR